MAVVVYLPENIDGGNNATWTVVSGLFHANNVEFVSEHWWCVWFYDLQQIWKCDGNNVQKVKNRVRCVELE
jgi:hypothetical protein